MRNAPELWVAAGVCWVACLLLLRRVVGWRPAAVLATVKLAIPVAYFLWYYDGTWTVIDDVSYFRQARLLLAGGYNPVTVLTDPAGFRELLIYSNGLQFLYNWYNLVAIELFGESYWAPVLLNVVLTSWAAGSVAGLLRDCGTSRPYATAAAVFFALHWDLVTWSSFLNVKDILVLTLTVIFLRRFVRLDRAITVSGLAATLLIAFVLIWVRFYVPLVGGVAFALHQLGNPRRRIPVLIGGAAATVAGVALVGLFVPDLFSLLRLSVGDLVFGWVRTIISPLPWSVQREYAFMQPTSVIQLIGFPVLLYGAAALVRAPGPHRIAFIYAALLLLVVAAYPDLQGPRHRLQILFVVSWCQFHGAYLLLAEWMRQRAPGGEALAMAPST